MYRQYLFVCDGLSYPVIAWASSKDEMRALVRDELGWPAGMPMPRHAVMVIA